MSSLKTTPVKITPLKGRVNVINNLTSLSKTIEKAQKNIIKNQAMSPHSSEENLKPVGTPLSHLKKKGREKRVCSDNQTPLANSNKINKSPQNKAVSRTVTPKSVQTRSGTPKARVVATFSASTPSKQPIKITPKKLKTTPSKYGTPIKNETNILFQFSKDIFETPVSESKSSFNEGLVNTGCNMERLNRSHSASSIFRLKGKGDEGSVMSKIKRSLSEAKLSIQSSCSEYEGEKSQITVGVRVRPLLPREGMNGVTVSDGQVIVASDLGSEFTFSYEHVFSPSATQGEVYETLVRPLLDNAIQGYNACLFAYGQTGSGKTYSMMGPTLEGEKAELNEESGMIPRFCRELLQKTAALEEACPSLTTTVEVSYLEVYNEKIHDLLVPGNTQLRVREHPVHGPYVVDLSRHTINSFSDFQHWITAGNKKRATAMTELNDKSSRSHSLFTVLLTQTSAQVRSDGTWSHDQTRRSQINLVDLAGSERIASTTVSSDRLREGASINRSLLTLGKVMSALVDNRGFVPYRESVLTWLLKESLGGNSRTCMLATVSPCSSHLDETMSTLRYASQARAIVNRVRVNEAPQDKEMRELREEVERLRSAGEKITALLGEKEELEEQLKFKEEGMISLETELEKYKAKILELTKPKEELIGDARRSSDVEKELQFEKEHVLVLEEELKFCQKQLSELKENNKHLEKELEIRKCNEVNNNEKMSLLKKDMTTLKNELTLCRKEVNDILNSKQILEEQLAEKALSEKRIFSLEEELKSLKNNYDELESFFKETKENEEALERKLFESNMREERLIQNVEQIPALENALNDLEKELRKTRSELAESKKCNDELIKQLHNSYLKDDVNQLTKEYNLKSKVLEEELQKYKAESIKSEETISDLKKKLEEITSREELLKMEADKVSNLESELRLLEAETRISKREYEATQEEKEEILKELMDLKEIANIQAREAAHTEELKKIRDELCQAKLEIRGLEKVIEGLNTTLLDNRSKEEQIFLQFQNSSSLENEFMKLKEELIAHKESSENLLEINQFEEKLNSKRERIKNLESELSKVKGQLAVELRAKEEIKNKLSEALTAGERMKYKSDQAIRLEIELEKAKNDFNEERKKTAELSRKLADYQSKEEILKSELYSKTQHLENVQSQMERLQQLQMTLMEEKLTLLKVMEKQCTTKESKEANEVLLEENHALKKDVAVLNEKLIITSKENGELRKKNNEMGSLLKAVILNEERKDQALKDALESKDKEMYEFIMDSAFPHHLVHLLRKARTFTEIYKIPYELELGEKVVVIRHLVLSAKATLGHLKLSKWIERIENEKTWFKSMDRDLPWEVDFGEYYEKNDAHTIILEDPGVDKNSAINIGTKATASGGLNPILWRKTMIKRHVMGLREDSDVLIQYFNEVEDSRVYSILSRIQVSVARLQEATRNIEK